MKLWKVAHGAILTLALLSIVNASAFCKWYRNALTDSDAAVVSGLCRATTSTGAGDRYTRLLMDFLYCSTPQRRNAAAAASPAGAGGQAAPAPAGSGGCTAAEETRACRTVAVVAAAGNSSICLPAAFPTDAVTAAEAEELPAVVAECLGAPPAAADLNCSSRQFNFFRMLGCVECGAEASTAAEIYACCAAAERMEDCAGACTAEGPVSIGTPVDTPGFSASIPPVDVAPAPPDAMSTAAVLRMHAAAPAALALLSIATCLLV